MKKQGQEEWRTQPAEQDNDQRRWSQQPAPPERLVAEFRLRRPDNHVLVFASAHTAHLHTTHPLEPPARASAFVRMLAAEGFLADEFAFCASIHSTPDLQWTVRRPRTRSAAALYWRQNWPMLCAWLLLLLCALVVWVWTWRHPEFQSDCVTFI